MFSAPRRQRQAEPLAQQCDMRMLAAELEARAVGQPHAAGVGFTGSGG